MFRFKKQVLNIVRSFVRFWIVIFSINFVFLPCISVAGTIASQLDSIKASELYNDELNSLFGLELGSDINYESQNYEVIKEEEWYGAGYRYSVIPKAPSEYFQEYFVETSCKKGVIKKVLAYSEEGVICSEVLDASYYSIDFKSMEINVFKTGKSVFASDKKEGYIRSISIRCNTHVKEGKQKLTISLSHKLHHKKCK